ncbi:hypothetical protein C1645_822430 [Glomus cerebriforme]|uniref:Uncharacterized protein n=1 Tax=Glomus cerebriforme TaxID=658196 RepID=A0A397T7X0_9GLOM|nr:hypothetical protein C1645_822430 [Glomus cerebriforme]
MSPKMDTNINVNNNTSSNYNDHKVYRYDDIPACLGNIPRTGKDPLLDHDKQHVNTDHNNTSTINAVNHNVNNNNNTEMRELHPTSRVNPHENINNNTIEDHKTSPMQDVILLAPINVSSNIIHNVSNQPTPVNNINSSSLSIPMDTSSTNDPLIKKANKHKKKKSKQELTIAGSSKFESSHVPTDMLIDVSDKIMNITFNEIVSESIDMIIDQLDSTHLSEPNHNLTKDQLFNRYSPFSTSTGILDKSHSFTLSNTPISQDDSLIHTLSFDTNVAIQKAQVAIKKDLCIKAIKAIRHKKEYLKSIKADESSSDYS